jgi:hypothetical protein
MTQSGHADFIAIRGGHRWSDDDYDVYDGERVIGRIIASASARNRILA